MADRHVEPGKDGWRVIKQGGARASATTSTRQEAIERARQIIANDGGGELVVHTDGGDVVDREPVGAASRERAQTTDGSRAEEQPRAEQEQDETPRRVQDEVEGKILDAGRSAASSAKQLADQGKDAAMDAIGKVRDRIGR